MIGYFAFFGKKKDVQESSLVFHSGFEVLSLCVVTWSFFSSNGVGRQTSTEIDGVSPSPYQVEIWCHPHPLGPLSHVSFHFELQTPPP